VLVRTLAVLNALRVASIAVFACASEFWLAIGAWWLGGVFREAADPLIASWTNRHAEPEVRATLFSLRGQCDALGQFAGGPALGWLALRGSVPIALLASAALLLPIQLLFAAAARRARRESAGSGLV